jgi:hypothetical protein
MVVMRAPNQAKLNTLHQEVVNPDNFMYGHFEGATA